MARYTPVFKEQVKQAYLDSGESLAKVAARFGVAIRTVEGWSKDGGWDGLRNSQKVVPISEGKKPKPQPSIVVNSSFTDAVDDERPKRKPGPIDEKEIVNNAIVNLDSLLFSMTGGNGTADTRGVGGIATALVKLLEFRRKIQPPTAAALVEEAISLGIPPDQFVQALKEAWRLGA